MLFTRTARLKFALQLGARFAIIRKQNSGQWSVVGGQLKAKSSELIFRPLTTDH